MSCESLAAKSQKLEIVSSPTLWTGLGLFLMVLLVNLLKMDNLNRYFMFRYTLYRGMEAFGKSIFFLISSCKRYVRLRIVARFVSICFDYWGMYMES